MSRKSIHKCDKCGKEFSYNNIQYSTDNNDMRTIEISFGQYNKKNFDLCIDCCKELGFIDKTNDTNKNNEINNIDNFLDTLAELVKDRL